MRSKHDFSMQDGGCNTAGGGGNDSMLTPELAWLTGSRVILGDCMVFVQEFCVIRRVGAGNTDLAFFILGLCSGGLVLTRILS